MRRARSSSFALLAVVTLVLGACAGESPTSPSTPPGGGTNPGTCTTTISLAATSVTPLAGTGIVVRATVTQNGAPVPDGTSVLFTVDFGFFGETGLPSVSKVTQNGFADVTLGALSPGLSKLKATRDCATANLDVEFKPVPISGPFISTIEPSTGSCAGGDVVTINGGRFVPANAVNPLEYRVLFGGVRASVTSVGDTQITVRTPARTLANPQVPETVDVTVSIVDGPVADTVTFAKGFTYYCVDPSRRMTASSVSPTFGFADGGETVTISGNNFLPTPGAGGAAGSSVATTQVTFGGLAASIASVTNSTIVVLTPRRVLADPTKPERVDVSVTVDLGMPSRQSAVIPQAFQYLPTFAGGACNSNPLLSIASVVPSDPATAGRPDGGDIVTINGIGFLAGYETLPANRVRVEFGGVPAVVTALSDTAIGVSTPRRTLANPQVSETVDVTVYVDIGGPRQSCAKATNAFTYRGTGTGGSCTTSPNVFISSVVPANPITAGSPEGGDSVTINGAGFFVGYPSLPTSAVRVEFGGIPATVTSVGNEAISVVTPRRVLANPQVPETVDVNVVVDVGGPKQTCAKAPAAFTYRGSGATGTCNANPNLFIASVVPADPINAGSPAGGDSVTINGGGFHAGYALMPTSRVRVEFGGIPAVVSLVSDTEILVTSPRRVLANPNVPETVDIVVTVDVGGPQQGCAKATAAFTYRGTGPTGTCNTNPNLFVSSVVPADPVNAGSPDGGDTVTLNGGGFFAGYASMPTSRVRVEFGGIPAVVSTVSNGAIVVTSPRRILADPNVPETVDIVVTVDVGGPQQGCAKATSAFTYRAIGPNAPCNTRKDLFVSAVQPTTRATGTPDGGESVTISGGGFFVGYTTLPASRIRVEFGGQPAIVVSVSNTTITVQTPRRVLANPDRPEMVDVVVTADVGGPRQACARAANAFTYYPGSSLDPVITSMSPNAGPNDASVRVTLFGRNFSFPSQVFVEGVEATVVSITANEIVFMTPTAIGPNSELANGLREVRVVDTRSGRTSSANPSYRYYGCPSVNGLSPSVASWNATTIVTIAGQNFEEPVEATFETTDGGITRLAVISVTPSMILVRMPALDAGQLGGSCENVSGSIRLTFLTLPSGQCQAVSSDFTYRVDPVAFQSLTPTLVGQAGGTPVTVTGTGFTEPMRVELLNGSTVIWRVAGTVINGNTLTFTPAAVPSSEMLEASCQIASGAVGTRLVTTRFPIRIISLQTGCERTVDGALAFEPADTSCQAALGIGSATAPAATICAPYGPFSVAVSGGSSPYTYTASGLPNGLRIDPASGAITGTPALTATGVGVASTTATFVVNVTDSSQPPQSASKSYTITLTDPNAPFAVTGSQQQTVPATGGVGSLLSVSPSPTPTGFNPINWTIESITSSGSAAPAGSITLTNTTGPSTAISVLGTVPANTYTVTLRATDSACGSFRHTATYVVTVTKGNPLEPIVQNAAGPVPSATLCQSYTPYAFSAIGGTPPYRFTAANLPMGMTLDSSTGLLTGRPKLPITPGASAPDPTAANPPAFPGSPVTTVEFTVVVTDSSVPSKSSAAKTFSIAVSDPNAPFGVVGTASQSVPASGGPTGSNLTAVPDPTPAAPWSFQPVSWRIATVVGAGTVPPAATGTWGVTALTGQTTQIVVPPVTAPGDYDVTVVAVDSSCDGAPHIAKMTVRVTKRP